MLRKFYLLLLFLTISLFIVAIYSPNLYAAETSYEREINKKLLTCDSESMSNFTDGDYDVILNRDSLDTLTRACTGGRITGAPESSQSIEIHYKFWSTSGFSGGPTLEEGSAVLYPADFKNANGQYQFCSLDPKYLDSSDWTITRQSPPIVTNITFHGGNNYQSQTYRMSDDVACSTEAAGSDIDNPIGGITFQEKPAGSVEYQCVLNENKSDVVCKGSDGSIDASKAKCTDNTGAQNCSAPWYVQCINGFDVCDESEAQCRNNIDPDDNTIRRENGGPFATEEACRAVAGGREIIEIPTATPTPPPPPCASDTLENGCTKITSAFGIIQTDPQGLITRLFAILLSLSGGIALLLIIRSGYQMMTSRGNAEAVKEAQDRITSAIVGLLFIIFSLVILEIIGVDLLNLPGLGR